MRAKTLLGEGAKIISPLEFYRSRPKVSGYMWGGRLVLEKSGIIYHFEMWHHGGDEMTESEALDEISLKGITYQGKYYDVYWYTVMTEDEIYLHPTGWFGNRNLEREVIQVLGGSKSNYNFARDTLNDQQRRELLSLGFIKIAGAELTLAWKEKSGFEELHRPFPQTYGDWVNLAADIKGAIGATPAGWDAINYRMQIIASGEGDVDDAKRWLINKAGELGIT